MATTKEQDVKSKQDVVGVAVFKAYDSTQEAVGDIGEATILKLINAQVRTNAMNVVRAEKVGKPSKRGEMLEAFTRLAGEDPAAVAACGGDRAKLEELINAKIAEMEREAAAAAPAPVEAENDPGEDDD